MQTEPAPDSDSSPHLIDGPHATDSVIERTPSWCDIAPWLTSRGTDPEFFWIDDDPAGAEPAVLRAHAELIAVLIAETLAEIGLGELLPLLPDAVDLIPDHDLPTRTANWLLQSSTFTTDRIRSVTAADILDSRGMGSGSVIPLLTKLVELSAASLTAAAEPTASDDDAARAGAQIIADLTELARWRTVTGSTDAPLLEPLPGYAPAAVHDARRRLDMLTAGNPAVDAGPLDVAQQLSEQLTALGERGLAVFVERRLATDRTRLEALGERFGVTRERVRQIEGRALEELFAWLENNADARFVVASATAFVGTLCPLDDLLAQFPVLGTEVPAAAAPLWRVLTGIGVGIEIADGWAAVGSLDELRDTTRELLDRLGGEFGVVDPEPLLAEFGGDRPAADPSWPQRWAAALGAAIYRGHLLTRTTTVEDYAAAILSLHGEPMSPDEIVAAFHVERSPRTLANQLAGDDRFQRASRSDWGLTAWGGQAYTTIRSAIAAMLDEAGGTVPLGDLVDKISTAYDVKASSVAAYAASPPFRTVRGIVSRAEHAPEPRKSPAQTRHLYRISDAWKLRITVNHDHLRGSGAPLPVALASALALDHGQTLHLSSSDGEQSLSWTALQPTVGSTRRFYPTLGIADGDEAFFVFTDDGHFAVEPLRTETADDLARVLAAIGAEPTTDPVAGLAMLAGSIGLPADSSVAAVRAALATRGEDDLAALLPAPPVPSPPVP